MLELVEAKDSSPQTGFKISLFLFCFLDFNLKKVLIGLQPACCAEIIYLVICYDS